jgi:hypothetical protein
VRRTQASTNRLDSKQHAGFSKTVTFVEPDKGRHLQGRRPATCCVAAVCFNSIKCVTFTVLMHPEIRHRTMSVLYVETDHVKCSSKERLFTSSGSERPTRQLCRWCPVSQTCSPARWSSCGTTSVTINRCHATSASCVPDEQHHRVAGDAAVLPQAVHLFVRLGLQIHGGGVRPQQRTQVVTDPVLHRRQLWPLHDGKHRQFSCELAVVSPRVTPILS